MQENNSGVNTVLIVIVLLIIVGGAVWFFSGMNKDSEKAGLDVEVNLPTGTDSGDTSAQ